MKKFTLVIFLILTYSKADIIIVANESFPLDRIENELVKKIFLRQQKFVDSQKVVPFNLSVSSNERKSFETKVLKMEQSSLKSYWIESHYNGVRPPKQVNSITAMKQYILNIKGAIGYLPRDQITTKMKQLTIVRE